jgi:hypothetical protein
MANDDRYEYVKGTYKYKKGLTPDRSRETAGAWRGTLRDDGGHLDGQAEFIPGDEDEYEWEPNREPVDIYVNEEREAMRDLGSALSCRSCSETCDSWRSRFVREGQTLRQEIVERPGTPGREVGVDKLAKRREAHSQVVVAESATLIDGAPEDTGQEVGAALEADKASMSSAEARDRFVAALMARLFSDEQLQILRDARIEYGDGPHALESAAEAVTAQQVGESITLMLEANPSLLDEETLTEILGVGRADHEYVPMRREQIDEALRLTDGGE